jgi:hypothetical protein
MEVVKVSKKVDVYTNEWYFGREMDVSEIIKDYPFLKNEHFDDSPVLTVKENEISLEYREGTDVPAVVWKRNNMTGVWAERVILE